MEDPSVTVQNENKRRLWKGFSGVTEGENLNFIIKEKVSSVEGQSGSRATTVSI